MNQETLEEAAERIVSEWYGSGEIEMQDCFIKGAKWQQERSNEEVEVENKWEGNGTMFGFKMGNASPDGEFVNKIIIPKEEQEYNIKLEILSQMEKQETLEEAAEKIFPLI